MTLNPLLLFGLVKRIEEYILAALSIGPYGYGLLLSILGGALLLRIEHEAAEARVVDRVDDEKQELFIELERGWELIPQLPHALDELKEPIRARVLLPLPVKPLAPRVSCFFPETKKVRRRREEIEGNTNHILPTPFLQVHQTRRWFGNRDRSIPAPIRSLAIAE
jgi:hypothetical protein